MLRTIQRWITAFVVLTLFSALLLGAVVATIVNAPSPASVVLGALGAGAVAWLLQRMDVARVIAGLELVGVALPLFAFLVVSTMMGSTAGTLRFAEVGAQVIVVLLLVLAIDARFFRLSEDRDRLEISATVFTLMVLAAGEYYALRSVITEDPSHSEMVAGAIAAGFAALVVMALLGSARSAKEDPPPEREATSEQAGRGR